MTELKAFDRVINGINGHFIQSDKFKTITFHLQFRAPLDRSTVTERALLSSVLKGATAEFPSTQVLSKHLDELYGATLTSGVSKKGKEHVLAVSLTVANERYIPSENNLLENGLKLYGDVFFNPHKINNGFDPVIVNREKRALKRRIESIYDDKMRYANQRLIDEMCKGEDYAIHASGYIDEIDAVTEEDLFEAFQHLIQNDTVDLYVVGDIDQTEAGNYIEKFLPIPERSEKNENRLPSVKEFQVVDLKEITEEQDIEQGKLHIGYRVPIVYGDVDYPASQIFNGLFGGFPHSKLFMNVREKASLAYYAASRYESYKGLMIVVSGIDSKKRDEAVKIIEEQLADVQKGDFTKEDLLKTKALMKNAFLENMDQPHGLIDWFSEERLPNSHSLDEWLIALDNVTAEDIIKVAKQVQCDTIYFLKGKVEA